MAQLSSKKSPKPASKPAKVARRRAADTQRLGGYLWAWLVLGVLLSLLFAYLRRTSSIVPIDKPLLPVTDPHAPWDVVDLPGKGRGVIATRVIAAGELMHRERPLLLLPPNVEPEMEGTYLLERLSALPASSQAEFYSLANTTASKFELTSRPDKTDVVHNIFHTNSMLASGGTSSGVFPKAARTNHACRPNAEFYFRDELGVLVVHALEDIEVGQEIHYAYFDASVKSRAARREYLAAAYGFECGCSVCSLDTTQSVQSDDRRAIIAAGTSAFEAWKAGTTTPAGALDALSEALKMMVEERYWTSMGQHCMNAFIIAASHGDYETSQTWAALATARFQIETGAESDVTSQSKTLSENPTLASVWAARESVRLLKPIDIRF